MQTAKLTSDDANFLDQFGWSICLDGDRALISAHYNDAVDDNGSVIGHDEGAAYVFDFQNGSWHQTAKLMANDASFDDRFGESVSLYRNRAIIGANGANTNSQNDAGTAYVFELRNNSWQQIDQLVVNVPTTDDFFGGSVDIYKDWVIVAASNNPNNGTTSGIVYVYKYFAAGDRWVHEKSIWPADGRNADQFGKSVSMQENLVLIGASTYEPSLIFADQNKGKAVLYDISLPGDGVIKLNTFEADDATRQSFLGESVSLSGHRGLVGAPGADGGLHIGAAYTFEQIEVFKNSFE